MPAVAHAPYVIRTVRVDAIDDVDPAAGAAGSPPVTPGRAERRAALQFDGPIAAAEVLLGPRGGDGRHRVLAGGAQVSRARRSGRAVLLAAVVGADGTAERVLARWHVHHAA
jgi:hypothetical protein